MSSLVCLVPEGVGGNFGITCADFQGFPHLWCFLFGGAREGLSLSLPFASLILYVVVCVIIKGAGSPGKQEAIEQRVR